MSGLPVLKDPAEVEAYSFDYNDLMEDNLADLETIVSSSWAVVIGDVTVASSSNTTTTTTVVLSGGTKGQTCDVLNTVTTNQGRTLKRSLVVRIGLR